MLTLWRAQSETLALVYLPANADILKCTVFCRAAVSPGTELYEGLTEKGVLQLLFDLRFLHEVVAAGRPAITAANTEEARVAGNKQVGALRGSYGDLESQLQVKDFPR